MPDLWSVSQTDNNDSAALSYLSFLSTSLLLLFTPGICVPVFWRFRSSRSCIRDTRTQTSPHPSLPLEDSWLIAAARNRGWCDIVLPLEPSPMLEMHSEYLMMQWFNLARFLSWCHRHVQSGSVSACQKRIWSSSP